MNLKMPLRVLIANSHFVVLFNALVLPWTVACICCLGRGLQCKIINNTGAVIENYENFHVMRMFEMFCERVMGCICVEL